MWTEEEYSEEEEEEQSEEEESEQECALQTAERPKLVDQDLVYRRSSRLEPKEDFRPRKTYTVVKPVIDGEFDKQARRCDEGGTGDSFRWPSCASRCRAGSASCWATSPT